ncbi:MAG: efflux RND transporter periplasmic adaptor subunit [Gammaproteobacteria bacterium]|nr:MAG: efflux RND transporter periplasmic adaptor subunit [Gammaproteobacteria bacterium]
MAATDPAGTKAATDGLNTVEARYETVPRLEVYDGLVEAVNEATVSAQTSGRIIAVNYDVDDYVEKGSIIVQFDDSTQKARLERARAQLVEAQARYNEARTEYERIKGVYERKLVSKSAFDKAEAAWKSARAKLNAARAALREAEVQYEYTRVRAPYSGIVTKRHVEVGEVANVGTPLMTGVSLEELRVVVHVPQRSIQGVRRFHQAEVRVDTPEQVIPVSRVTFFPYADPQTHTFRVRAWLEKDVQGLFPGMFVKTAFRVGEDRRLLVPQQAVVFRSEVTGVYVVHDDGRLELRQIRLGRHLGERYEILAGLEEGERVATDPEMAVLLIKRENAERIAQERKDHE